jgi:hypothetical protein
MPHWQGTGTTTAKPRLRRLPAQRPRRGGRVGDALENPEAVTLNTAHWAIGGPNHRGIGGIRRVGRPATGDNDQGQQYGEVADQGASKT